MTQTTDEQLLTLFCQGDTDAFTALLRRYEKELFNFLNKFVGNSSLAQEAFQEAFLQVHISAASFDVSRRFKPWLYTIAANKARDMLRSKARRPSVNLSSADDNDSGDLWSCLLTEEETPADIVDKKDTQRQVRGIIAKMPENQREILLLGYFQQLSYKEMAETLGIPIGTVKSRLHSAVSVFAKRYEEIRQ